MINIHLPYTQLLSRFRSSNFCAALLVTGLTISLISSTLAEEKNSNPFPPDSAEHAALVAAAEALSNDAFLLRQDYWKGSLTTELGKALQLQFFKGNRYRFFFAVNKTHLPKNAQLHLHIYNKASTEVASVSSEDLENVIALEFKPKSTGLYLVLMSIELPKTSNARRDIPAVMFYGYE